MTPSSLQTMASCLTPEEARAYWYGLINFEQRLPSATDLKLDRMRRLLEALGNPQQRLRILHVAGTKGKGSTSAMLASILRAAGYRTGLFTSPHLCRVEERFQVDGQPISDPELTLLLSETAQAETTAFAGREGERPTFFEVATAVGFLHFVRRRVEAAVVEVGLGGRFDSTNVCLPRVALLTSIGYDHTKLLGNRLASIAMEKAGIVKPGRPTLSGATLPEARAVIEQICRERRSPLRQLEVDFRYIHEPGQVTAEATRLPRVQVLTEQRRWPALEVNLLGEHQACNAAVAVACIEELRRQGWQIADQAVAAGLATVTCPARLEVVRRRPLIVLDCAHNTSSARAVVETLRTSFPPVPRRLIFAGSSDKDLPGILSLLAPHFSQAFLTRYTSNPRAVAVEQLAQTWREVSSVDAMLCPTPRDALAAALAASEPEDVICITGSVFLAGELRPVLV